MPEGSEQRPDSATQFDGFVENYLLYLLARASEQVSAQFHAVVKSRGLGVMEWRVLASTSDTRRTIGELARMALAQQPTLTKVIDRMERDGWVKRVKDEMDGRRVWVAITAKGRRMVADLVSEARQHESQILAGYDDDEAAALKATLRLLIERTTRGAS